MHFQSRGLYGRVVHLQPMTWHEDGWPRIGWVEDGETCGEPVEVWEKPCAPKGERLSLQASDAFRGRLGLQWQFMGAWREDFYVLVPGGLRLYALAQQTPGLWHCPQALTQKIACPAFTAEVSLDASGLQEGTQAGLALLGGQYAYAALRREADGLKLVYVQSEGTAHTETVLERLDAPAAQLNLRLTLLPTGPDEAAATFEYTCGSAFRWLGQPFRPTRHTWVGARIGLFAAGGENGGYADFGPFVLDMVETLD